MVQVSGLGDEKVLLRKVVALYVEQKADSLSGYRQLSRPLLARLLPSAPSTSAADSSATPLVAILKHTSPWTSITRNGNILPAIRRIPYNPGAGTVMGAQR